MTAGADLSRHMEAVAVALFREPNRRQSKGKELRFETNGSMSVDIEKGTFYSHEEQIGGGVLDLIKREKGFDGPAAVDWMRDELKLDVGEPRCDRRIVAEYNYRDEAADLLFQVVRFEPKDFRRRRPDGAGGWSWSVKGVRQVPYRLPELIEALAQERPVVIVEGEKDAEALAQCGIPATCNAGGAGKWRDPLNEHFRGADVAIIPDNDPPGQDHARDVAAKLLGVVRRVRILELPGLPPKGDVSDWIKAGGSADEFWRLVETASIAPADYAGPAAAVASRLVLTLAEFLADFAPPDYLVDGLLQRRFLYSLTGKTGHGKTAVAVLLAATVALRTGGQRFGPHAVEHGRVIYIAAENPLDVQMRFIAQLERLGASAADLNLHIIANIKSLDQQFDAIRREVEAIGAVDLVVVDTSPALFPGNDENSNPQMRDHAARLRKLTELPGKPCVVALCHPIKGAQSADDLLPRGGGAFLNEVDGNLSLWKHDGVCDLHWQGKFRGPDFTPLSFRIDTVYPPAWSTTRAGHCRLRLRHGFRRTKPKRSKPATFGRRINC
jgi:hypothetical protein